MEASTSKSTARGRIAPVPLESHSKASSGPSATAPHVLRTQIPVGVVLHILLLLVQEVAVSSYSIFPALQVLVDLSYFTSSMVTN